MTPASAALVVLVHGLGRTPLSLWRIERALGRAGYRTRAYAYASRRHGLDELARQFRTFLGGLHGEPGPIHFVGHSLGAILIRAGLTEVSPRALGRIVLLAPPNRGTGVVARLARAPWLMWRMGPAVRDLGPSSPILRALPPAPPSTGIVAGTSRFHPLTPASWVNHVWFRIAEEHDGTVELASTRLEDAADFIALPVGHTFMPSQPAVIRQVLAFLREGRFER
ncbi:MAG: alpha/beta hydrolase [Alphaproteobacteria bacterium]|nr:alpha/beta hydrolase [Alphaproteobacteria bacterium]